VETAVAPSWEDIGKLAAIAAIRTLLNYFLQKEIQMEQQHPPHSDLGQQPHDDTRYSDFPERRESVPPVPQR
jgi:lipase chaperone LimK